MSDFDLASELSGLFRANIPLINLVTYEEDRVVQTIGSVTQGLGVYTWDQADLLKVVREAATPMPKTELVSDKLLPFLAHGLTEVVAKLLCFVFHFTTPFFWGIKFNGFSHFFQIFFGYVED